jgi:hypothetical protein
VNRKYPPLKDKFEEKIGDSKGVIRRHNSISEDKQYKRTIQGTLLPIFHSNRSVVSETKKAF